MTCPAGLMVDSHVIDATRSGPIPDSSTSLGVSIGVSLLREQVSEGIGLMDGDRELGTTRIAWMTLEIAEMLEVGHDY